MNRVAMETYCFGPSEVLRQERADLSDELMAWLLAKAKEGKRPLAIQYALLDVAAFASGRSEIAAAFWAELPVKPAIGPSSPASPDPDKRLLEKQAERRQRDAVKRSTKAERDAHCARLVAERRAQLGW